MNEPRVFSGEPPVSIVRDMLGDYVWTCQCGATGASSSEQWAHSDVERHRQNTGCNQPNEEGTGDGQVRPLF